MGRRGQVGVGKGGKATVQLEQGKKESGLLEMGSFGFRLEIRLMVGGETWDVETKRVTHLLLPALASVTGLGGPLTFVFGYLGSGHCRR